MIKFNERVVEIDFIMSMKKLILCSLVDTDHEQIL